MPSAKDVFVNCDELEHLPVENRENYLFELEWLEHELPSAASVLQVGSMDGMRILRLLEARPDLVLTGIEIEPDLVLLARANIAREGRRAEFVVGDITDPPQGLDRRLYAICLNNTLGFIPDVHAAMAEMRRLGTVAVVSVYGERFDEAVARRYFTSIGLELHEVTEDRFVFEDFSSVQRFSRSIVESWGDGKIVETPLGYLTVLDGDATETARAER